MIPGKGQVIPATKQTKYIFFGVLIYGLLIQLWCRTAGNFIDPFMWADQIKYFLNRDPRMFDFNAAYGHPGTTLVLLGGLFHIVFGLNYVMAVALTMSILISAATAASAAICSLLFPRSLWWITTAFILLLDLPYLASTPITAIVIPFTVLIVLATWWLWESRIYNAKWMFFIFGILIGIAAATRLDVSLLVGASMIILLWYRHGHRAFLQILTGTAISFFVFDPFLWFMPVQHVIDLVHKFTMHYEGYSPTKIELDELVRATFPALLSIGSAFFLLVRGRLSQVMPVPVMLAFFIISILASAVILTSSFQCIRYFSPFIIVWEVLLPLFVFKIIAYANRHNAEPQLPDSAISTQFLIVIVILIQLLAYVILWPQTVILLAKIFK